MHTHPKAKGRRAVRSREEKKGERFEEREAKPQIRSEEEEEN